MKTWILLVLVDVGLRLAGFDRVHRVLQWAAGSETRSVGSEERIIERLRFLVEGASNHHLYAMTCLRRALVLQFLLRRRGLDSRLRIGVRRNRDQLLAHAWLERGGRAISELNSTLDEYQQLDAITRV